MKPIPEGFHAITPYLFAQGASRLIEFISAAFEGELIFPAKAARWRNHARHDANRRLDADAGRPGPRVGPMPTSIYLYVADCDAVYHRALSSGGVSVFPMMTLPSGQRYGGIKDPCGNILVGCHARRGCSTRRAGTALERIQNATTRSGC